ncbi:IclR family transcriptional regulator [Palleronia sp.]|uniref:IclR family transcriptional regulator n=1 Tax=Palleronia sp. TaxID=1940284 RepID=UPI0035C831D3
MGTITNALTLLNHFSSARAEIGLASFVRLSGGDKATVRRYLVELQANGFLEQNEERRSYRLGPAVLRLAAVRESNFPVRSVVAPVVDRMAEALGELVHASVLQGGGMSPIYHADPRRHGTQVIFDEAEMLPLHATASGLAMLAFGPEAAMDYALSAQRDSFAANTVIAASDLREIVRVTRARGFSFADQFFTNEVLSYGMPFFGMDEVATGTVAVPVPQSRMTAPLRDAIIQHLRAGCAEITAALSGTVPPDYPMPDPGMDAERGSP